MLNNKQALELMVDLMSQHNLIQQGWKPKISNSRTFLGYCNWHTKLISLSIFHVENSEYKEIVNTILHEIAHALVGPSRDPHGPVWKRKALEIGCNGNRCGSMKAPPKYIGVCPNCTRSYGRNKRGNLYCSFCMENEKKGFVPEFKLIWKTNLGLDTQIKNLV